MCWEGRHRTPVSLCLGIEAVAFWNQTVANAGDARKGNCGMNVEVLAGNELFKNGHGLAGAGADAANSSDCVCTNAVLFLLIFCGPKEEVDGFGITDFTQDQRRPGPDSDVRVFQGPDDFHGRNGEFEKTEGHDATGPHLGIGTLKAFEEGLEVVGIFREEVERLLGRIDHVAIAELEGLETFDDFGARVRMALADFSERKDRLPTGHDDRSGAGPSELPCLGGRAGEERFDALGAALGFQSLNTEIPDIGVLHVFEDAEQEGFPLRGGELIDEWQEATPRLVDVLLGKGILEKLALGSWLLGHFERLTDILDAGLDFGVLLDRKWLPGRCFHHEQERKEEQDEVFHDDRGLGEDTPMGGFLGQD